MKLPVSILLVLLPLSAAAVDVGCKMWIGEKLAYEAPRFAHQPYVVHLDRRFEVGLSFDGGRFGLQIADGDRQIDRGGYTSSAILASSDTPLAAPGDLTLSAGDDGVTVKCTLTLSR